MKIHFKRFDSLGVILRTKISHNGHAKRSWDILQIKTRLSEVNRKKERRAEKIKYQLSADIKREPVRFIIFHSFVTTLSREIEMQSIHLYLALALFVSTYNTTTAISTTGCTSDMNILKNDTVERQIVSFLKNEMDIIEIQVKTNTCIALTNDGYNISNKLFTSASPIEKYNMFIYFIVTDTGRSLMKYPADTDTMALRLLGSPKVVMDVDVMLDNNDCALNKEQFRTIFLQTLSTLAPITNNDDISVCYYEVSEKDWRSYVELLFLPYYTYNNFKTFCLTGGVVADVPQTLPNKLLRWLCIALHLTLPIGFFFIPHAVHDKTDLYRKCDVPFSVSMFLSYISYWASNCKCASQCGQSKKNPLFRLFVCITIISISIGIGIHFYVRYRNDLENDFLALTGSSAFYYIHPPKKDTFKNFCLPIVVFVGVLFIFLFFWALCCKYKCFASQPEKISYPIYLLRLTKCEYCNVHDPLNSFTCSSCCECCQCYDANDLTLETEVADLNTTIKLLTEVVFNLTFWLKLLKRVHGLIVFYAPVVLIFSIPYLNNCIGSAVEDIKHSNYKCDKDTCKRCESCRIEGCKKCQKELCHISLGLKIRNFLFISIYHLLKLICTIVIVNMTLMHTTTLILQWIVLTLFVGIPVYPKLLPIIILLTGFIKYIVQAFLKFQSKSKYVLDQMFKEKRYEDKDDLPKKEFDIVKKQCSSVNFLIVVIKIVALMFVWLTAYFAIMHGPKGLSAWKDVIPSVILFIAPDWLSKCIYNEAAENQYIDQCVKKAMQNLENEIKNDETEEGWDCRLCCSTGGTEKTRTDDIELTSTVVTEQTGTEGTEQTSTEETALKQISG